MWLVNTHYTLHLIEKINILCNYVKFYFKNPVLKCVIYKDAKLLQIVFLPNKSLIRILSNTKKSSLRNI